MFLRSWLLFFLLLLASPVEAASRFLVCTTTCTITAIDTSIWSAASGGATGASVPGASDAVILDSATCVGGTTCTATMNFGGTWTIQSFAIGTCTASTAGCIFDNSVNNNNIVLNTNGTAFNASGTGTRTLNLGTATYTVSGTTAVVTFSTTTNLTLSAASSTLSYTGTGGRQFTSGGALTFGTLAIAARSNTGWFRYVVGTGGGTTFGAVTVAAPNYLMLDSLATITINTAIAWTGTSANQIGIATATVGAGSTLALANGSTCSWCAFREITASTGAPVASNSFDLGDNSGITFSPPGAGGAHFSATVF